MKKPKAVQARDLSPKAMLKVDAAHDLVVGKTREQLLEMLYQRCLDLRLYLSRLRQDPDERRFLLLMEAAKSDKQRELELSRNIVLLALGMQKKHQKTKERK